MGEYQARCSLKPHHVGRDAEGKWGWDNTHNHKGHYVTPCLKKKKRYSAWIIWFPGKNILPPAMATSSLMIYSKAQKQQVCSSWPNTPQSTTPWLQTTQLVPKLSPGEDNHSSGTCQVPRLVAAVPSFCGACPASDLGLCLKKNAKKLCLLRKKCRAKRQQLCDRASFPPSHAAPAPKSMPLTAQARHGHAQSFGGSLEDWQWRPIHNIFLPILAHRPQQ